MSLIFSEVLDLVDKAKTKEERIGLLRKYGLPALKGILRINFDPNVKMDLPDGEPPYRKEVDKPIGYHETNLIQEYKRFYIWLDPKQNLTKIRKEKLFIEMLEGLHHTEAEIVCLVKDRKLTKRWKNIKADVVREAFPGLLPPVTEKEEVEPPLV